MEALMRMMMRGQVNYEDKLMQAVGAIQKFKGVVLTNVYVLRHLLGETPPDQVDMSRADAGQLEAFKSFTWNPNAKKWFWNDDCDYRRELFAQVEDLARSAKCNKWVVLFNFIQAGYDLVATKFLVSENFVDMKDNAYGMDDDSTGWEVVYNKVLELSNVAKYVPPTGYHCPTDEERLIAAMREQDDQDDQEEIPELADSGKFFQGETTESEGDSD